MIYCDLPLRRPALPLKRFVALFALWHIALLLRATAVPDDADALQKQAIQRIDQYRDYARRTGDVNSLLPQLQRAQYELTTSIKAAMAAQNFSNVSLSLLKLGDIERLQNHWDSARSLYANARKFAKQANNPAFEAQALTQMAK